MKKESRNIIQPWIENFKIILAPLSCFALVVSIISFFVIENDILKYAISGGVVGVVLIVILIFLFVRHKRTIRHSSDSLLAKTYLREFERMRKDRSNYSKILELGPVIAKNLYLTSCYDERIAIANIIKKYLENCKIIV